MLLEKEIYSWKITDRTNVLPYFQNHLADKQKKENRSDSFF